MEIVIIGTGNTATILGRKFKAAGHNILQVYGRNVKAAADLSSNLNAEPVHQLSSIRTGATVYLIAVSDSAIAEIANELSESHQGIIVHTAGSVAKNALSAFPHHGVFYPLQTLKKESNKLPVTPIVVDASDEESLSTLGDLAGTISDCVVKADDIKRIKLHLAAVFANNFVNHIYSFSEEYCNKEELDFKFLLPLIEETALRVKAISPSKAQTGPASRHDAATIQKHEELLKSYPSLKKFYTLFTESIWNQKREL